MVPRREHRRSAESRRELHDALVVGGDDDLLGQAVCLAFVHPLQHRLASDLEQRLAR
jgi:hypothetical protein